MLFYIFIIISDNYKSLAPAGIFFRGRSEVHLGRAYKGRRRVGGPGGGAPGSRRSFQNFKKINKNLQFFDNFSWKNLQLEKLYRIFRENFGKNLEYLRNMHM